VINSEVPNRVSNLAHRKLLKRMPMKTLANQKRGNGKKKGKRPKLRRKKSKRPRKTMTLRRNLTRRYEF